ncbi:unnamed protein product [Scytosiphon promiscuus]
MFDRQSIGGSNSIDVVVHEIISCVARVFKRSLTRMYNCTRNVENGSSTVLVYFVTKSTHVSRVVFRVFGASLIAFGTHRSAASLRIGEFPFFPRSVDGRVLCVCDHRDMCGGPRPRGRAVPVQQELRPMGRSLPDVGELAGRQAGRRSWYTESQKQEKEAEGERKV